MTPYLKAAHDAIADETAGLDAAAIAQPVPGRWSIAEILEHLTLSFTRNAEAMQKALASGELRARKPRLRQRLGRILVIDIGYFPRAEAPEMTRPARGIPPERSVAAALEGLRAIDTALARVSERFGDRVAVANHPYFAGLTVPQWAKFHWRHTIHHMRQVRAARRTSSSY